MKIKEFICSNRKILLLAQISIATMIGENTPNNPPTMPGTNAPERLRSQALWSKARSRARGILAFGPFQYGSMIEKSEEPKKSKKRKREEAVPKERKKPEKRKRKEAKPKRKRPESEEVKKPKLDC